MASLTRKGFQGSDNATLLLIGGGLALAYFGAIKPALDAGKGLLEAAGLKDSAKDKKEAAALDANDKANGWNPNYYQLIGKQKNIYLAKLTSVDVLAKTIYNAKGNKLKAGGLNDDEEAIYGALRKVPSQAHLSQLADRFQALYKKDLLGYLKSFLSSADHFWSINEMAEVAKIVAPLPNYILYTTTKK